MLYLFADTTPQYGSQGASPRSDGLGAWLGSPMPRYSGGTGQPQPAGYAEGSLFDLLGVFSAPTPRYATPPASPASPPGGDDGDDDGDGDTPSPEPPGEGEDD